MSESHEILQDRLAAVGRMMEESPKYEAPEVLAWHSLAQHVDQGHFDRTGQIVTDALSALEITRGAADDSISESAVEEALAELIAKGHLAPVERAEEPAQYQLFLRQPDAPGVAE